MTRGDDDAKGRGTCRCSCPRQQEPIGQNACHLVPPWHQTEGSEGTEGTERTEGSES